LDIFATFEKDFDDAMIDQSSKSASPKFWDKVADKYSRQKIGDEESYQKKLEKSQSYFRPDMELLEFGCGTGGTAIIHAPHVKHIRAIDISPKMIESAESRGATANVHNVDFEVQTIENLNAPDESFDAILGLSIMHLVQDKETVLDKVFRLLKPSGVFISSTVCMGDMTSLFRYVIPLMQFFGLAPFVAFFTREELLQSIRTAGFKINYEWRPGKRAAVFVVAKKPI
jgi:ubiquinone/menaquinone biosynthesis C-methylase UbiE